MRAEQNNTKVVVLHRTQQLSIYVLTGLPATAFAANSAPRRMAWLPITQDA
jgi:hypothetical protein